MRRLGAAVGFAIASNAAAEGLPPFRIDADRIDAPLAGARGDAARGREIAYGRDGNCLLCHAVPDAGGRPVGNVGPSLAGVGARLSPAQLRLQLVAPERLNPRTPMPSYYRVDGLHGVAAPYRGKPILTAQEIEDVVAFLTTLK